MYRSVEEVPEEARQALIEGVQVAGRKLRQWRGFGEFTSLTARWTTGDRTSVDITCDSEDHIWLHDPPGSEPLDISEIVDKP